MSRQIDREKLAEQFRWHIVLIDDGFGYWWVLNDLQEFVAEHYGPRSRTCIYYLVRHWLAAGLVETRPHTYCPVHYRFTQSKQNL